MLLLVGLKSDLRGDSAGLVSADEDVEDTTQTLNPPHTRTQAETASCVTFERAQKVARQLKCPYVECSAKTGDGVYEVFRLVAELAAKYKPQSRRRRCTIL